MTAEVHGGRAALAPPLDVAPPLPRELAPSFRTLALSLLARAAPEKVGHTSLPGLEFLGSLPQLTAEQVQQALRTTRRTAEDEPLARLGAALRLSAIELLAIALLQAVDEDPRAAYAVMALQTDVLGARPTLGLLAVAFAEQASPSRGVIEQLVGGSALGSGVVELLDEDAALPDRRLALPTALFLALRGRDGPFQRVAIDSGSSDALQVPLGPALEAELVQQALALRSDDSVLCIRSGSPAEARSAACAIARTLGRRAAFIEPDAAIAGLGAFLLLRDLLPVFPLALGPGEQRSVPSVPGYSGPRLVLTGPDGAVETLLGAAPDFAIPVPPSNERELLWTLSLGDSRLSSELAAQHRHGPGRIAQLSRMAFHFAAIEQAARLEPRHVKAASWIIEGGGLGSLARELRDHVPDEGFVTSPSIRRELEHLVLRCRFRERLSERLGPALQARAPAGVRALFVGPSGTGKTLAASWLAGRLGLPLYRIDLASVTSKYIGETEKNLAAVLARAERADVALLFDEADSLFGRRTEVRDSNDRFANAQTNYLLQRIESYDGVVVLTSNSRSRFDSAFSRRLDAIIEFSAPGPEERRSLWRAHLGDAHTLTSEELNRLAAAADLAGGSIRNAVLAAAVIAAPAARPIGYEDLLQALAGEYGKLGLSVPPELGPEKTGPRRG